MLLIHLLLVRLGERAGHASARVHAHADAHEGLRCTGGVAARSFHAACHSALHITLAHGGIGKHGALVAHVDELLGFLVVGDAGDTDGLDLHAAHLPPFLIERVGHVLGELAALGGQEADALAVRGELVDGGLERLEEFVEVLLVDVLDVDTLRVARDRFGIELQRVGDLDGIAAVRPQEQLGVIEVVVILQRAARAELDALDLLQVHEEYLLLAGGNAAVLHAGEGLLHGSAKLAVEEGGHAGIVHLVITGLRRVVHDLAAVHKQHALVIVHMDDRAVGDGVVRALGVRVALIALADLHACGEHSRVVHGIGFDDFKPRISKTAADCA